MAGTKSNLKLVEGETAPSIPTITETETLTEQSDFRADQAAALAAKEIERRKKIDTRLKCEEGTHTEFTHDEPYIAQLAFMEEIGTKSLDFIGPFIQQVGNAASKGQDVDIENVNFALSVVKGIDPQDEIEAMLGAQMAAIHMATMTFARRLNHVDTIEQQESAEKTLNKLARTFTTQMAALKKYKTGGEQKVKVEHVHVHEGGQAVVGNVSHTTNNGGVDGKS